jgi:hypothetical protein
MREACLMLGGGMLLGIPAALLLTRFVGKLLYQVPTFDPLGIAATVALLGLGGLTDQYFLPAGPRASAPSRLFVMIDPAHEVLTR